VYFNSNDASFKTSIGTSKYTTVTPEIAGQLDSVHEIISQDQAFDLGIKEINIKTSSDAWICGKRSMQKQTYSVVSSAKSDLHLGDLAVSLKNFVL
jgi:glutamate mutase epsilon subunit